MGIDPTFKKFLKYRYAKAWIKTNTQKKSEKKNCVGDEKDEQKSKIRKNKKQESSGFSIDPELIKLKNQENGYPDYYSKSEVHIPGRKEVYYPKDAHVAIFDCTSKLKDYPEYVVKNGNDYIFKYVLYEAITFLGMTSGCSEAFFMCFDRGSPANKDNEHSNRYSNLNFHDLDTLGDDKVFISDTTIIDKKEWPLFANDKKLKQELIHYITRRIVDIPNQNEEKDQHKFKHYIPPENKILFLFGGFSEAPTFPRSERKIKRPDAELYFVTNEKQNNTHNIMNSDDNEDSYIFTQPSIYKRVSGAYKPIDDCYKLEEQAELLEGELSCIYFSKPYINSGKNVLFISGDGDLLLQLLLTSKDRLNESGGFKNKIYLRLITHNDFEDIDINLLFISLCEDPLFKNNGITDPSIYITFASCLIKNDYYSGFCNGIGNLNVSGCECPIILYSLLSMLCKFKDMISILPSTRNNFEEINVFINEKMFVKFVYSIYVVKYKTLALKKMEKKLPKSEKLKFKSSLSVLDELELLIPSSFKVKTFNNYDIKKKDIQLVNEYLNGLGSIKNRIMCEEKMRVYCRMTEWIFTYYYNSYRGKCKIVSPLSTLDQESYYGWTISITENKCVCSDTVSKTRISDIYHLCNRETAMSITIKPTKTQENIVSNVKVVNSSDLIEANMMPNSIEENENGDINFIFLPKKLDYKSRAINTKPFIKKNKIAHVSTIKFTEDLMSCDK